MAQASEVAGRPFGDLLSKNWILADRCGLIKMPRRRPGTPKLRLYWIVRDEYEWILS